jgi:hypothetical protein
VYLISTGGLLCQKCIPTLVASLPARKLEETAIIALAPGKGLSLSHSHVGKVLAQGVGVLLSSKDVNSENDANNHASMGYFPPLLDLIPYLLLAGLLAEHTAGGGGAAAGESGDSVL